MAVNIGSKTDLEKAEKDKALESGEINASRPGHLGQVKEVEGSAPPKALPAPSGDRAPVQRETPARGDDVARKLAEYRRKQEEKRRASESDRRDAELKRQSSERETVETDAATMRPTAPRPRPVEVASDLLPSDSEDPTGIAESAVPWIPRQDKPKSGGSANSLKDKGKSDGKSGKKKDGKKSASKSKKGKKGKTLMAAGEKTPDDKAGDKGKKGKTLIEAGTKTPSDKEKPKQKPKAKPKGSTKRTSGKRSWGWKRGKKEKVPDSYEIRNTPEPKTDPVPYGPPIQIAPDGTMITSVPDGMSLEDLGLGWETEDIVNNYRRPSYSFPLSKRKKKQSDDDFIWENVERQADEFDTEFGAYPNQASPGVESISAFGDYEKEFDDGVVNDDAALPNRENKIRRSVANIMRFIKRSYIPLESQYVDESGNIRFDPNTEAAINSYMAKCGFRPSQKYLVFQQVAKSIGFSPDRYSKIFGIDAKDVKISDDIFVQALVNMTASMEMYGHPYAWINPNMTLGGTRCVPIGVMTLDEAQALCNGRSQFDKLRNKDPYEVMSDAANEWRQQTLPTARRVIYAEENGSAHMAVLEDMVRAVAALDGMSSQMFLVSEAADRGLQEILGQCDSRQRDAMTDKDTELVTKVRRNVANAAFERLDKRRNRPVDVYEIDYKDANGNIVYTAGSKVRFWHSYDERAMPPLVETLRDPSTNKIESAFISIANFARFSGVVGNFPIMVSGLIEHAQGDLNTIVANQVLFGTDSKFRPTKAMYRYFTSKAGVEGIKALKALHIVGGMDAVKAYYDIYPTMTQENVKKFLDDYVRRETSDGKLAEKSRELGEKMNEVTRLLMPGDVGFGKEDARRWAEAFMINMMHISRANEAARKSGKPVTQVSLDASEVSQILMADGVEKFLAYASSTVAGRDALVMARNQTLARESPLTHTVDAILRMNGVTDFAVTMFIDTYFLYGINLIQNMIPFSNTISFLAVRGVNGIWNPSSRSVLEEEGINVLNYQMGGLDSFGFGLWKNLVYDFVKCGNILFMVGMLHFVLGQIGFDEPEELGLKYNWNEYRVGGKIGLGPVNPETGEHTGVPVYAAWWLNDLTLFGLPAAYALKASELDQKLGEKDPKLAEKLFFSGCKDMVSGAGLFDMMRLVNNISNDIKMFEKAASDQNAEQPELEWTSFALIQAELACARAANKLVPSAFKNWRTDTAIVGEDVLDRTAYDVYDRDSDTPGKTKSVEDPIEILRRIESKHNPLYALFNNRTKNGYWFDDGSTDKTGYLFDEQPIATAIDDQIASYAALFDYDPDNIPGGEDARIPYREQKIADVIAEIETFNSVEEAVNHGFFIPYNIRSIMRDFCYQNINAAENVYNQRVQDGIKGAAKTEAYTEMDNTKKYWYDLLNNWVFSDKLPWSDKGYARLLTDWNTSYYYLDTGMPCTVMDYWLEGDEKVGVAVTPRGNHPTSLFPFTTPDTEGKGYNFETVSKWYTEGESGTDLQRVFDRNAELGAVVPYGRDEGIETNTAVFGGTPTFKAETPLYGEYNATDKPTMGYRGYVEYDVSMLDELKNVKREDVGDDSSLGDLGVYKPKDEWKSNSNPNWNNQRWPSYGKRSYGGSSYNPKIYSASRSISFDRPSTMRSQRPYSAQTSYLRPAFYTKGSREAYRRQDM